MLRGEADEALDEELDETFFGDARPVLQRAR
jgi:hypothetical protein